MDLHRISLALVVAAADAVILVKDAIVGDARWWNLVIVALLLVALVDVLRSRRHQS